MQLQTNEGIKKRSVLERFHAIGEHSFIKVRVYRRQSVFQKREWESNGMVKQKMKTQREKIKIAEEISFGGVHDSSGQWLEHLVRFVRSFVHSIVEPKREGSLPF